MTDALLLRIAPPRVPGHQLARPRLQSDAEPLRDCALILLQAPAGFGKTSLLAQWRLEHLARGSVVAWMTAQAQDDAERLVQGLTLAVRAAAGRPGFGRALEGSFPTPIAAATAWLAEVAQTAMDVVLIVDEADHLQGEARESLAYVLHNAPSNLRVVTAARSDIHCELDDLVAYGACIVLGPATLRFQLGEAIELVRGRFGDRVDRDAVAHLHELSEGWPLGLQLALAVMARGADPQAELARMLARGGRLREQFVDLMLSQLDPADLDLLTRVAILDLLHPDLCRTLVPDVDVAAGLERLVGVTPVLTAAEGSEWMRMHALAREELLRRFASLPSGEQAELHLRASRALAAIGMLEAAAQHALEAGQREIAFDLAERGLYASLMARGQQGAVLKWLEQMPAEEVDRRPRLLLAAAWSLALGERHGQAGSYVERILARPGVEASTRCECALIQSAAAIFADDPDQLAALHDPWANNPPLEDPMLLRVHANRSAYRALIDGEPALARLLQQNAQGSEGHADHAHLGWWGDFILGLSYLWEGQVLLAERLLRPTLEQAEAELGRRSAFACTLASLLAAALWERNAPDEAGALLANRLDVLERGGLPEAVLLAFRTLARIAAAEGAEHRTLELLSALDAVGMARRLPRLRVASLVGQVRTHARRFRSETCRELCEQIDALLAGPGMPQGPRWRRSVQLLRDSAQGHAAIAAQDWRTAAEILGRTDDLARELKLGHLHIELLGLRAYVLDRLGERSIGMLREAADLAAAYGLVRVFDDAHPALGNWARQALPSAEVAAGLAGPGPLAAPLRVPQAAAEPRVPRSTPSMALTPKEREVLELLARNLSNKEIGLALQVGEQTIKWHMKNLFAKLDAGTRKQVVQRARLLGLLDIS